MLWVLGSRDGCGTGLEATNDSSQWVCREAAGERQGNLAAGRSSGSGSEQSRCPVQRINSVAMAGWVLLVVPSRSRQPVVVVTGCCWSSACPGPDPSPPSSSMLGKVCRNVECTTLQHVCVSCRPSVQASIGYCQDRTKAQVTGDRQKCQVGRSCYGNGPGE